MTTQPQPDFQLREENNSVGFEPLTQAARDWLALYSENEPCCWFGRAYFVNHDRADSLTQQLVAEGFTIGL